MSRSVPLWEGSTPDAAIPTRVKLRIWERCGGRCGLTGRKIMPGDQHDYDHIRALILGGAHREDNIHVVLRAAHKLKTADDVARKAKADRVRAKHLGIWPQSKRPLKSRGFEKAR